MLDGLTKWLSVIKTNLSIQASLQADPKIMLAIKDFGFYFLFGFTGYMAERGQTLARTARKNASLQAPNGKI